MKETYLREFRHAREQEEQEEDAHEALPVEEEHRRGGGRRLDGHLLQGVVEGGRGWCAGGYARVWRWRWWWQGVACTLARPHRGEEGAADEAWASSMRRKDAWPSSMISRMAPSTFQLSGARYCCFPGTVRPG